MALAISKFILSMQQGRPKMSDWLKLAAMKSNEKEEVYRLVESVLNGKFSLTTFSDEFPLLSSDDNIIDHVADLVEKIVELSEDQETLGLLSEFFPALKGFSLKS